MLLWLVILSVFLAIVVYQNRHKNRELLPYVITYPFGDRLLLRAALVFVSGDNPFMTQAAGAAERPGPEPDAR